jgi:hypothetical protein
MKAKYLISILPMLILLFILYVNIKLYFGPEIKTIEGQRINYDLLCELRGLREALDGNADQEMQQLYPEGYLFFNALYGLSWCEFIKTLKPESALYKEGHVEIQRAFEKIDSDRGRSIFDESLDLPYGSFYTGWSTYLLGKKLAVESIPGRDQKEIYSFQQQCDKIAAAIQKDLYPETYYHQAWPADVVVCVASLSLHDRLFRPKYSTVINEWLGKVKQNLDPIGLIPHAVTSSGKSTGSSRGSSQSLMLNFLAEIDQSFAEDQFDLYKHHFLVYRFGLPGIREYPNGNIGVGDIDSGPVIAGIGAAASIVGFKTMNAYGEIALGTAMRNSIEAFGLPVTTSAQKKYLFGALPMADAFIAWGHSSESIETNRKAGTISFYSFHIYSAGIALLLMLLVRWLLRK